jgi:hypothetical protein
MRKVIDQSAAEFIIHRKLEKKEGSSFFGDKNVTIPFGQSQPMLVPSKKLTGGTEPAVRYGDEIIPLSSFDESERHVVEKYLKENTFRGNDAIADENKMNFLAIPVGMTPVAEGDQDLAFNPRLTQRNYMTKYALRDYEYWTEGGAWVSPRTNGDDKFKVHFLNESLLAVFNAEKFIIGKGVAS